MRRLKAVSLSLLLLATAVVAEARDSTARAAFMGQYPCPATGKMRGQCPGYVVDHVRPLCAGGADHPANMQWQDTVSAKIKDRDERRECARMRYAR